MKKILKIGIILAIAGLLIGGGVVLYLFNMPHRDVQSAKTDFEITAASLVQEYLTNPESANEKYLDTEGESKILEVTGQVASIDIDFNNQVVVLLKSSSQETGVSCTFLSTVGPIDKKLAIGQNIKVKGVIRSGASYDPDLGFFEPVIMEKCDIISKI